MARTSIDLSDHGTPRWRGNPPPMASGELWLAPISRTAECPGDRRTHLRCAWASTFCCWMLLWARGKGKDGPLIDDGETNATRQDLGKVEVIICQQKQLRLRLRLRLRAGIFWAGIRNTLCWNILQPWALVSSAMIRPKPQSRISRGYFSHAVRRAAYAGPLFSHPVSPPSTSQKRHDPTAEERPLKRLRKIH